MEKNIIETFLTSIGQFRTKIRVGLGIGISID